MRILALETSLAPGSVALLDDQRVLGGGALPVEGRTTGCLAPAIAAGLQAAGWRPDQLDLVAVSQGPGSFTGLRVGVTTAKALAWAVGAEILGVDTLAVIARQAAVSAQRLWAVVDAHRSQLFAALFERDAAGLWQPAQPAGIVDTAEWLRELASTADVAVAGPPLAALRDRLPPQVLVDPPENWVPQAATVGQLARAAYLAGRRDDVWSLAPRYLRRSAAEEKADKSGR